MLFSHPVLSLSSSPCSGGIRRFAECFTFCRRNNRTEIRDLFDSRESDEDSLRRSARSRRGRKRFDMEISCREVRQELANYMEDDITEELRLRIERHFMRCDG